MWEIRFVKTKKIEKIKKPYFEILTVHNFIVKSRWRLVIFSPN